MAFDDDNENDYGHSHDASGGRGHYGNTSSFSTTSISEDGQFMGIKLSPQMASDFQKFYGLGLDWARRKAEHLGVPLAQKVAKGMWGASEHEALHFGNKAGNVIGYSVILSNQILDVGRNIYDSTQYLNQLRTAVKPLEKSGSNSKSTAALSGNNEVVANARKKINNLFWQRLLKTTTGAIAAGPAFYSKWNEQAALNLQRADAEEYERAKGNPEAMAKYADKKVKDALKEQGLEDIGSDYENGMRQSMDQIIEKRRIAYKAKLEAFKKSDFEATSKKLDEAFTLTPENIYANMQKLERYGIETNNLKYHLRNNPQNKAEIISDFATQLKSQKSHYLDEALISTFVKQNGAFDDEQAEYLGGSSYNRAPTIKDKLEQVYSKVEESHMKTEREKHSGKKEHDGKGSELGTAAAGLGAGLVGELATNTFGGKALEKLREPIALDKILHLRRTLEQAKDHLPEQVPPIPKSEDKEKSYVQYVHDIFQQHQKDCGRAEVGDRFFAHLEDAGWDDKAIFGDKDSPGLTDEKLTSYEYAVKSIAKRIKDGRMDPIALIALVGDRHKKIVRSDGHSFGPQGIGKDEESVKKAIHHLLDEQTMMLHAGQKQSDEQVNDKLGNFIFSVDDLKHALESKELDKQHRAFIFTVFSDVVGSDESLCKKLGISDEKCHELRKECKESFNNLLDSAVVVLAEMIQSNPELEKQLKLTDKEKILIISLSERAQNDGKEVADSTENREELKSLETVIANAAMTLDKTPSAPGADGKPQGFWQRLISVSRQPKQAKKPEESAEVDKGLPETPELKKAARLDEPSANFADDFDKKKSSFNTSKNWRDTSTREDAGTMRTS